jgi:hypothetical protein
MRLLLLSLLLSVPLVRADNLEPGAKTTTIQSPREIKVKGLPARDSDFGQPTKIASKAELEKAIPSKDARRAISQQVDFNKEILLLFLWSGSGSDKLTFTVAKGKVAVFHYQQSKLLDLDKHARLFVLPRGMSYRLRK